MDLLLILTKCLLLLRFVCFLHVETTFWYSTLVQVNNCLLIQPEKVDETDN